VICFNPEQAERDAGLREVMLGKLNTMIADTDRLTPSSRIRIAISALAQEPPGLVRMAGRHPAPAAALLDVAAAVSLERAARVRGAAELSAGAPTAAVLSAAARQLAAQGDRAASTSARRSPPRTPLGTPWRADHPGC
jgi:hypothetical protein